MLKKPIILFLSILIIFIAGCGQTSSNSKQDNDKLSIYTTIYPIQYMVERLAGDAVRAQSVYPPGTDAHSYEPTVKVMTDIAKGDAFIFLGSHLEAFTETVANALESEDTKLIELGTHKELFVALEGENEIHSDDDTHEHEHEQEDGHSHGDYDPHIWLDPVRAIDMATIIRDELIELLPKQSEQIEDNYVHLETDLQELNEQFENALADKQDKKILVSHAAYGYWEQRYGIEQIAVNGMSSNSEPSQKQLIRIIEQAKANHMEYMIFEQNVSETVASKIQEEIGASTLTIHNLSVLTEQDINNDDDYLSLMKRNIDVLNQAIR